MIGLAISAPFNVTIATLPVSPAQVCAAINGVGSHRSVDVSNVIIHCSPPSYRVSVTISGLQGSGLGAHSMATISRRHPNGTEPILSAALSSTEGLQARGIASDLLSNFYVVGYTYGSLDGNRNLGGTDIFIARYDVGGERL